MAKEIERKFLVKDDSYKALATGCDHILQGYISRRKEGTVRVRIKNSEAFITVKGITRGAVRDEWEYPVPVEDARAMLERVTEGTVIEKHRYLVPFGGKIWEIDNFGGELAGLVVAEVELNSENERIALPPFIGKEVTGDSRYYNSSLASGRSSGGNSSISTTFSTW